MSHFNFQNLGPEEFEALAKDIMQRLLGMPLFRYAAGPDGGIDLCDDLLTNRIIVQCKRYRDYKSLLQSLKDERKKLERLAPTPEKYYVFTSVGLLPQQKKTVLELFQPYMDSEANIFDAIAIEDFFNAPQNYDLISKNKNLFVAYPAGYDQREESERQDLRDRLDRLLCNIWEAHRSYKLMQTDEIERRLFPNIQDAGQFEALGKRTGEEAESPVWSIIRESWGEATNRPVMIQGKGGIGKTVTLFSLTNMEKDASPAPAVYVPMFELVNGGKVVNLTDYFQSADAFPSLTPKQRDGICELAAKPWVGPSLLVLLDGFNEVPGNQRWNVLQMLRTWHDRNPGAQLISVSRPMDNLSLEAAFGKETISITLSELTKESVTAYLKSPQGEGVRVPDPHAPIWETIVYPLFLNLYIKADRLRDQEAWQNYPLDSREATGPGSVIWNYLQRELLRQEDEQWILRCALANEYFAPILAYRMLQSYDYTISQSDALAVIKRSVSEMNFDRMPDHIMALFSHWKSMELSVEPPLFLKDLNWPDILLRECGLLVPYRENGRNKNNRKQESHQEPRYEFLHQNFRDCLAGLYLVNQAEMAEEGEFPEIWRKGQNHLALNYAAELMKPTVYEKLWEANRRTHVSRDESKKNHTAVCNLSYAEGLMDPAVFKELLVASYRIQASRDKRRKNHTAVCNLLDLWKRNIQLTKELDFSGMDLQGLSLTHYLGKDGQALPLFRRPELTKQTQLNRSVFESEGHTWPIKVLSVLPDGRVVSGSEDFNLQVWDATTGQCLQTLKGHAGVVTCMIVLPDGRVVSGLGHGTLQMWDTDSGLCLQALEGHTGSVTCVALLPDRCLVSGSGDSTLRVWDADTGQCLQTMKGHTGTVTCVTVLPDGRVVSGSIDCTLRVWDVAAGQCLQTLEGHTDWIRCVVAFPDGRVVSGSGDGTLRVWDAAIGQCLKTLEGHFDLVTGVTVLPDGRVVSGSIDRTLRVWDVATGRCQQTFVGHTGAVTCVSVLPDGRTVSGSMDSTLRVWDVITGQCLQILRGHADWIHCVVALPDGRVVSGSKDCTLRVWDAAAGQCLQTLEGHIQTSMVNCMAALQDGQMVCGSKDYALRVWDVAAGQCLQTLEGHTDSVWCVAALPDGRLVSGSKDGTLRVWDAAAGQCLQTMKGHTGTVTCVTVLPNGRVVSGSIDCTLRVWDVAAGKSLQTLEGHTDWIRCVVALPDGRVVSGSDDKTLRVWDAAIGQCLKTLEGHFGLVTSVAALPDGRVVSGSEDETLRVWDAATGQCLQTLEGHTDWIRCVVAFPDGRVVSGSYDRKLHVWDVAAGQCLQTLEGHKFSVYCVAVLPDGRVVSGSEDGTLRVWDPNTGDCLDVLEAVEVRVARGAEFQMNFSEAVLTEDLARLLWHNGAKISVSDYEKHVKPFRKAYNC